MDVPLEVAFKNIAKSDDLQNLIEEKARKLEDVCRALHSCRVIVEKPHEHQRSGSPFRITIDMRVAPGHEIVVRHEPGDGAITDTLHYIIRDTFKIAWRNLRKLDEQLHGAIKKHPEQETAAIVDSIHREEGYGFIRSIDGREIYFHRNSVLHGDWDELRKGVGVRFVEESGEDGPQASTVQIVARPEKL